VAVKEVLRWSTIPVYEHDVCGPVRKYMLQGLVPVVSGIESGERTGNRDPGKRELEIGCHGCVGKGHKDQIRPGECIRGKLGQQSGLRIPMAKDNGD